MVCPCKSISKMIKKLFKLRQSSFLSGYRLPRRHRHAIMKCPMPRERCVSTTKSLLYHVMFNLMIRNISDNKIFLKWQIGSSRKRESISDTRHYRTTENFGKKTKKQMNSSHVKNIAFSRKDAKERVICTKLSRSKRVDFFHAFEVRWTIFT